MCSASTVTNAENALVLIPCCKQKNVVPHHQNTLQPVSSILPLRNQLLQQIQSTGHLASRPENQRGILNTNAPLTQAVDLYVGNFYRASSHSLSAILAGQYPSVHVLIVSAFYGLVRLGEGLKEYDLKMGDALNGGMRVYKFWQQNGLWQILQSYINKNNITHVWSLLPDSMPLFPYHNVFNNLWRSLRSSTIRCFHVKVPGAGTGTGYKRAQWLENILTNNPDYLIGKPFPPSEFSGIPKCVFNYLPC